MSRQSLYGKDRTVNEDLASKCFTEISGANFSPAVEDALSNLVRKALLDYYTEAILMITEDDKEIQESFLRHKG